uniref:G_PROTEIN_RECEP_F2_4 domain-containing protein n=1 Tax=Heligmosomoides polygyrus TaxID=6339 RepID=A0A183GI43_HELPZ
LVGLCGAASYRRGLVITFLVMSIHAIIIFVPAIIIVSSFDIHFYQHECWGECDWHLLATSLPRNSRCQIMCGDHVDDNMRVYVTVFVLIHKKLLTFLSLFFVSCVYRKSLTFHCFRLAEKS